MLTISATEFKTNFGKYLESLVFGPITITKNNKPYATVSSLENITVPKEKKPVYLMTKEEIDALDPMGIGAIISRFDKSKINHSVSKMSEEELIESRIQYLEEKHG